MDERSYNTPTFDKDIKYCDCEDCNGTGFVYEDVVNEVGDDTTEKQDCQRCEGSGVLEIK